MKKGNLVYYSGKLGTIEDIKGEVVTGINFKDGSSTSFCGSNINEDILFINGRLVQDNYSDELQVGDIIKLLDQTFSLNEIKDSWQMIAYCDKFDKTLIITEISSNRLMYDVVNSENNGKKVLEYSSAPVLEVITTLQYSLTSEQLECLTINGFSPNKVKV